MGNADAPTRRERELKKYLRDLTDAVRLHVQLLDEEMLRPADHERGKRVARLSNDLELVNDRARYFALGVDYRTDAKRRAGAGS
jgi:hypothetical protein